MRVRRSGDHVCITNIYIDGNQLGPLGTLGPRPISQSVGSDVAEHYLVVDSSW